MRLLQFFIEIGFDGAEELQARTTAVDEVVAVGVDLLAEERTLLYVSLAHFGEVAEVHVVVGRTVDEEQVAMQLASALNGVDGITVGISLGVRM